MSQLTGLQPKGSAITADVEISDAERKQQISFSRIMRVTSPQGKVEEKRLKRKDVKHCSSL